MQAVEMLSNYISQGVYTVAGPFHPFGGAVDIIVVQQEDGTFKCTPWYVKFGKFQGVLKRREKIVTVSVNGREADFHMYLDHKGEAFFCREVESEEDETIFSPPSAPSSSDEAALPGHGARRTIFKEDSSNGGRDDGSAREKPAVDSRNEMALSELPHPPPEAARVCQNTQEDLVSLSKRSPGSAEKQQQAESNNPDCGSPRPSSTDAKSGVKNGKTPAKSPKSIFSLVFRSKSRKFSESQVGSVADRDGKEGQGETGDFHRITSLERAERFADLLEKKWATGDFDGREEGVGCVSAEVACYSGSSGLDAATGGSEQHETGANSDDIVCSSLLSSDEQVISAFDPVSGEVTEENPEVVCNHLEGSTVERLGGTVVELGHSVQEAVSERWYSETETGTFMVEESSGKCNEPRQQISGSDVARLSGHPVPLESVSDLVQFAEGSTTIVVNNLNDSRSTVSTHVSSSDMHSRSSNIDETRLDLCADPDSVREPSGRIRAMQQLIEVPVESFTEGSDDNEGKRLEHGGEKRDEECDIHVLARQQPDEYSFCDCNASVTNRISAQKSVPEETFNQTNEEKHPGEVDFHDQLVESKVNNVPKEYLQMEFYTSISKGVPDQEGEQKKIGQHVDEMHRQGFAFQSLNDSREPGEHYIQEKRTHVNAMSRSGCGEEFELAFNSDYALKSCLTISDPNPPSEKGKSEDIVSLTMDEEGNICRSNETDKTNGEFALSFRHPDESKAPQTGYAHVAESILPNSDDNSSKLLRSQTSPINITNLRMKGRVDSVQVSGSLPNMGLHTENPGADRVLSRSLDSDSVCLKQGLSHDIPFSNSENMESNAFEKGTIQGWTATEASVESWSTAETAIGSMQPENGVEISLCGHLLSEGMGIDAAAHAFESARVSMEEFHSSAAAILKNEKLIVRIGGQYFPWDAAAPIILGMVAFGLECPVKAEGAISVERVDKTLGKFPSDSLVPSGGGWRLWPFTFRRLKTTERSSSARPASKDDLIIDRDASLQSPFDGTLVVKNGYRRRPGKRKVRSNTPTSEQLLSLNLKEGQNIITFTFSTRVLGKQQVDARIYLWKWNTRIVISDVDGTITKSDVLGQFMPLVGKDWTQSGVAHLFSAIKDNGYQLLFLSARAIAQAYLTRQFLVNIKQDGKVLPDGPVVMSPDGLFPSLYREVIRRAPHEFKIACLEDIRALFPPDCNPFYAGFGNRDTDEISYLKVGIPKGKIFIINPKGEVAVNHLVDMKSYTSLHKLVNGMFPAMSSSEQEDFNSWNYWKVPLPDIDG